MNKYYLKNAIDKIVALTLIILFIPIYLLIAIILYSYSRKSPFFYQLRPGKDEKIFNLLKFKTMNEAKDKNGKLLSDAERLTKIGKIIRQTSLDELPQLLNVLRGDMSIVGPRPLLVQYLPLYNTKQKRRHEVKPGITGWAQINGRNAISWEQKFDYDVWYVDNQSFCLDVKILLLTIMKVFNTNDINKDNYTTMETFTGNN